MPKQADLDAEEADLQAKLEQLIQTDRDRLLCHMVMELWRLRRDLKGRAS